jgi:hypothetical protein
VHGLEEMLRLQEIRDPIERIIVDQNGAQQRLLRLDIVRRDPVGRSCVASSFAARAVTLDIGCSD